MTILTISRWSMMEVNQKNLLPNSCVTISNKFNDICFAFGMLDMGTSLVLLNMEIGLGLSIRVTWTTTLDSSRITKFTIA